MSERSPKRSFAARPADPESWIKASDAPSTRASADGGYSARLTIDITSDLRGRIKIAAFQRGVTVADMLRELLAREFPTIAGDPS
ncbi:hypothetical protein OVY48_10775 [Sphingobium sp. SA2]|uniref:Plasmid segregation centromere-binding protein ParG n=2 Tax=Sphingomonas TaxID=13687 RepID=A0A7T3ACR1_SPHPI|nr:MULTISPECIES: hypothetical protein [Alphaproteobacteria]KAB2735839.1 hypothetical protein F9K89_14670 [Brucella anthropi]MDT7533906.1 hypothetical protein [Sphingobium sp. SA2]NJB99249.1 hypothetical protein [Sphingomonas trueperi]QPT10187.1 hypothetical protein I6G38_08235 [Sphingomonas paucimobilis]